MKSTSFTHPMATTRPPMPGAPGRLRARLAASLVLSMALATPGLAADLNTNLVVNAGFESLGNLIEPQYSLSNILGWDGPGYAQNHAAAGWANGAPLAVGESFYYAGGGYAISQEISLATGDVASAIAAGRGEFELSAWFSGFSTQADFATVSVSFFDSNDAPLTNGLSISTPNPSAWNQDTHLGNVPWNADRARLTITSQGGGWADGYVDNVVFQIALGEAPLAINVNRTSGDISVSNPNEITSIEFDYYEILSPSGSLLADWNSFEDQGYDAIGSGVGQHWTEGAGVNSTNLTEVFLLGTSNFAGEEVRTLAGAFNPLSPEEDIVFRYGLASDGELKSGLVSYSGSQPAFDAGDFDADGDIDSEDWATLRSNQHANLTNLSLLEAYLRGDMNGDRANNHADFVLFKTIFDAVNGPGSFALLVASVPEPATAPLIIIAIYTSSLRRRKERPRRE